MDPIELSGDAGLVALTLLTMNVLLGLVMSVKYNPVRRWPHRRINTFKLHNWTGYLALAVAALHPSLLLFSKTAGFSVLDLMYPLHAPKDPWVTTMGALALYAITFVVITSYFRRRLGRKRWKSLHFTAYAAATLFVTHGILADPTLEGNALDLLDAEKVYVELCGVVMLVAIALRVRWQLRQPPPRQHRPKQPRRVRRAVPAGDAMPR